MTQPDLREIRARLAERGLLRDGALKDESEIEDEAHSVIPSVPEVRKPQRPSVRPADERDELGTVTIGCPSCHHRQAAPVDETRFRCDGCRVRWTWAICRSCRLLLVADDDVPAWTCTGCGVSNRSWWHAESGNEAIKVAAERRRLAEEREQERVRAGIRRRARKVIGWLTTLVVLTLGTVVVVSMSGPPSGTEAAGPVCHQFRALKSDISNGSISLEQMQIRIGDLNEAAKGATAEVQSASALLKDVARRPGGVEFKSAMADFEDACAAAGF